VLDTRLAEYTVKTHSSPCTALKHLHTSYTIPGTSTAQGLWQPAPWLWSLLLLAARRLGPLPARLHHHCLPCC
jgi:hypothetical protein